MVFVHVSFCAKEGEIILTEGQTFMLILFCQYAETEEVQWLHAEIREGT